MYFIVNCDVFCHRSFLVNYCRINFELPSVMIAQRSRKFADKYRLCDNVLCKSFVFR